jgi:NCS2 family nucleobase:cation symporter-2
LLNRIDSHPAKEACVAVKQSNLIYGVTDRPPSLVGLLLGIQHVSVYFISLIFPVLVVREMGGTAAQTDFPVSMSMVAGGVGAMIQALPRGPVGSGYLCPQVCGPSFISASILSAKMGGLPLVFGMTAVAGVAESLFSRVLHRLRFLFPAEVTGLIVALVGLTVVRLAPLASAPGVLVTGRRNGLRRGAQSTFPHRRF